MRYHHDMNFTMIRNWVGQTGDDEFYEACDRHGIVIWQDFWLANPVDGPDPDDNDLFLRNVTRHRAAHPQPPLGGPLLRAQRRLTRHKRSTTGSAKRSAELHPTSTTSPIPRGAW